MQPIKVNHSQCPCAESYMYLCAEAGESFWEQGLTTDAHQCLPSAHVSQEFPSNKHLPISSRPDELGYGCPLGVK